jgi:hypothetical protein
MKGGDVTAIAWDQIGQRYYEAGVDRGVLYMPDGSGVGWNGIISVNEKFEGMEGTPIYFDGTKFGAVHALGEYASTLRAYTYPDEFIQFEGIREVENGLYVTNQPTERFGLTYRSKVGNDVDGLDLGYKIHVLYNLSAVPSQKNYATLTSDTAVIEFEWNVTSVPEVTPGFRATAHLIFDSRETPDDLLQSIEEILYGNEVNDPSLPPLSDFVGFIDNWVLIRIIDNLDGTWTAEGPNNLITMLDPTLFQIAQANVKYVDAVTYLITDTTR